MTRTPWDSPDGPASELPASGWRADPTGRHKLRYWNGTSWTDDVSDGGGVASSDPLTTASPVKWYRLRLGPLPVWGWALGAFVVLGAIGNLTDEGEPEAPTTDADRATTQEAESATVDKSDAGTPDIDENADGQSASDEAASDRITDTTSEQSVRPPTTTVLATSAATTTTTPTTTSPPASTTLVTTTPPATPVPTTAATPETTAAPSPPATAASTTADTPEPTAVPSPPANPGDSKNCSSFSTYAEAKAWFDTYFPYYGDVARLDSDSDGEPCESLPGSPE